MKKNIIFVILLMMPIFVANANDGKVMLQSGGKVLFFDSSKINDAIVAAQEGDTVDLAAGTYNYQSVLVNKNILLRGKSADRSVDYTQLSSYDLTISSTCRIEGIYIYSNIKVTQGVSGLRITSCSFGDITFAADMPGMLIERSWCRGTLNLNNLKSKDININNCNIAFICGGNNDSRPCTFRNCNISNIHGYDEGDREANVDKFINCILSSYYHYAYGYTSGYCNVNVMVNCLCHVYGLGVDNETSSYYFNEDDGKGYLINSNMYATCSYSKEELVDKGYLGTDGTVVGSEGDAYPYTLTPVNTRITKATISVDETNMKVSADVEVKVE